MFGCTFTLTGVIVWSLCLSQVLKYMKSALVFLLVMNFFTTCAWNSSMTLGMITFALEYSSFSSYPLISASCLLTMFILWKFVGSTDIMMIQNSPSYFMLRFLDA